MLYDLNVEEFFLATWANWRRVKCVESKETEENIDKCKEVRMLDIDMCTKMNDAWANGGGSNVLKLKTIANGGTTAAQEPPSLKVEALRLKEAAKAATKAAKAAEMAATKKKAAARRPGKPVVQPVVPKRGCRSSQTLGNSTPSAISVEDDPCLLYTSPSPRDS